MHPCNLPDLSLFLDTLTRLSEHPLPAARALLAPDEPIVIARAPGRLDLMGGIADYSGSLVLQLPLREAAFSALQRDSEPRIRIVSLGAEESGRAPDFEMPLAAFEPGGEAGDYERARAFFRRDPTGAWAGYVAGAFLVLSRERGVHFDGGARILISSDVPEGAGVSSSAALEVAVMQAVCAAFDIPIEPREVALLCQVVENRVVGAPCGVMDQMTAACGEENRLLALLCQPAELQDQVLLPDEVAVWGIDSGVRHSVAGADYGSVRAGAFMGYRILAELSGLPVDLATPGEPVHITDTRWRGYLANLTPSEFEQRYSTRLPEHMRGAAFLEHYGGMPDTVTRVDPDRDYAVRTPTVHPISEHFRVRVFAELLHGPPNERRLELLGELMYQSHASYSACGLGSPGTDRLMELVREAEPAAGLYGAKITGGGSGGTVAVLGRRGAGDAVARIAAAYAAETGHPARVFSGSSPGAAAFGVRRWNPAE